jgi:hypothetical protein
MRSTLIYRDYVKHNRQKKTGLWEISQEDRKTRTDQGNKWITEKREKQTIKRKENRKWNKTPAEAV